MGKFLLGNEKHGCLVDNESQIFKYYDLLSLYEKINKENNQLLLNYSDIQSIDVSYSLFNSDCGGSATICLSIHTADNEYDCPLYFSEVSHNDYIEFSKVFLQSDLCIHDPKEVFKTIIEKTDTPIGTLLFDIDKTKK